MKTAASVIGNGNDRTLILNALNEVLHGLNASQAQHIPREQVQAAWDRLHRTEGNIAITAQEARILAESIALCFSEFQDEEFQSRLGVSKRSAEHLVANLKQNASGQKLHRTHAAAS